MADYAVNSEENSVQQRLNKTAIYDDQKPASAASCFPYPRGRVWHRDSCRDTPDKLQTPPTHLQVAYTAFPNECTYYSTHKPVYYLVTVWECTTFPNSQCLFLNQLTITIWNDYMLVKDMNSFLYNVK